MRRTKQDAEKTKQALAVAALEVFAQKGYSATKLVDIAELAGVTRGAVYHHFSDKKGAYMAATAAPAERLQAVMLAAFEHNGAAGDKLRLLFLAVLKVAETEHEVCQMLELQWLRTEILDEFSDEMANKRRGIKAQINSIADLIDPKSINTSRAKTLARGYMSLLTGTLHTWLILEKKYPLHQQGEDIIDAYLSGIKMSEDAA
ncbi:MAG: TetR family transcriptional regulator [Alphaproteobacteria bacterium]|nr:TetR family transcriptional regulator [Alphaproteobacteria bacterium]